MVRAAGDPDAVSVGDFHLPNLVAFTLAGEIRERTPGCSSCSSVARSSKPRVIRLLEMSGLRRPRSGRAIRRARSPAI